MNVQQVTSRYHGIQNTIKDVLKKCSAAVGAHRDYDSKYQELCQEVFEIEGQCKKLASTSHGDKGEIVQCQKAVEELFERKQALFTMLNSVTEVGEKLLNYTAPEGKDSIQVQMRELNNNAETVFDDISRLERELKGKLDKWAGYEESSAAFSRWLKEVQDALKCDILLKATLDEKKAQLQSYRNLLQDVKSQKPVLDDLLERSQQLPEVSESTQKFISTSQSAHHGLQAKAQAFVEAYEAIVANHQQYMKAVMELGEWMTATHNTIEMWSDTSLERLSLHANLERIKNIQGRHSVLL